MERATWTRRVVLLIGAAAAAAALIGGIVSSRATAASPTPAASAPAEAGKVVLKIGLVESLDSLNPFIGWTTISYELFNLQYLKLAGRDTETLQPTPGAGLAESWEVSPDGLTWTFHLYEDLTWHDGEPVTAEDVAFTLNYIIDNEMSAFTLATRHIEKAVVVDPYTVQIICTQPKANLLGVTWFVLPKHIWSKISPEDAATRFENSPPVIGDGPFQVVEWKRNDYLRLVANKDFRCGPVGPAKIDELLFVQYQSADTMVEDLKAGNLDAAFAYPLPPAQFEALENTPGVEAIKFTWFNWAYLAFNCYTGKSHGNPVLRDRRFRVALEYAIDRQRIVDVAYQGYAIPGYTFLPPGYWKDPDYSWQPPDGVRRDFDPAKANQLLDEAGYKMGPDGIRLDKRGKPIVLRLWAAKPYTQEQTAAKLIAGWFRKVGVGTELAVWDEGVYYDAIWNYEGDTFVPDFDMYLWSWDGYAEVGQNFTSFTTSQIENNNEFAWSNKEFDRLDEVQMATLDPDQRAEVIKQLQEVMYEDAPCIVTAHYYMLQAYRTDKWQGWQRENYGKGAAFCASTPYIYQNLEPRTATASGGGPSLTLIVVVVVVAAVAAGVAILLVLRGRRRRAEEV
jgi:peptide/nickel transport system substrate-binding protein